MFSHVFGKGIVIQGTDSDDFKYCQYYWLILNILAADMICWLDELLQSFDNKYVGDDQQQVKAATRTQCVALEAKWCCLSHFYLRLWLKDS